MAIVYPQIFKSFKFAVEIENPGGSAIVAAFAKFSGIRMKVDVMRGRVGDEKRGAYGNIPGLTAFENVTLSKGVIGDNEFMEWVLSVAPSESAPPTGKNMKRTITIVALTEQNQRGVEWQLINCMPVGYSTTPLDASKSGVFSETLEFAIEGFKRIVNAPASEGDASAGKGTK